MQSFILMLGLIVFASGTAWAESPSEMNGLRQQIAQLTQLVQQINTTVTAQQQRLTALERTGGTSATPPTPIVALPRTSGGANLSAFNPEIGVVADVVGTRSSSSADAEGNDRISAREVELVFGHAVDPYSRFDATIAFSDFEEPALEEAYLTHWGLPAKIKTRLGRFRPKIGKAAASHRDALDTIDEPLVVSRYFGAEGLSRTGAEFSGFLPLPWTAVTHELTAGMMEGGVGEGGTLFGSARHRPSFYAHLKNFWDITDATNLEVGSTYLTGSSDEDRRFEVHALGVDATLVHHVTPANKLQWQSEAYFQSRGEAFSATTDPGTGAEIHTSLPHKPFGFYSLADYRVSPQFGVGGRFDYVEPAGIDPALRARHGDTAWSGYLTFYQSEFARWRLQFRNTQFAAGGDDNTIMLQGTFAIGVHTHALQ